MQNERSEQVFLWKVQFLEFVLHKIIFTEQVYSLSLNNIYITSRVEAKWETLVLIH